MIEHDSRSPRHQDELRADRGDEAPEPVEAPPPEAGKGFDFVFRSFFCASICYYVHICTLLCTFFCRSMFVETRCSVGVLHVGKPLWRLRLHRSPTNPSERSRAGVTSAAQDL